MTDRETKKKKCVGSVLKTRLNNPQISSDKVKPRTVDYIFGQIS